MLKKLLLALGIGVAAGASPSMAADFHQPYADASRNLLYNLLFCDDPSLLQQPDAVKAEPSGDVRKRLLAPFPDLRALRALADNPAQESRVRALAFHRMRAAGQAVPPKILLGVIVEVPQAKGLDALAAFADGGVRYLNQSAAVMILEGRPHPAEAQADALLKAAEPLLARLGPLDGSRRAPPRAGHVRITFLVSDGLYIGEGPADMMHRDALGGPLMARATALLVQVVDTALAPPPKPRP